MYKKWVESRPFDIGNNTRSTIGTLVKCDEKDPKLYKHAYKAGEKSKKSKSNGSMMRISPLVVWCSHLRDVNKIS